MSPSALDRGGRRILKRHLDSTQAKRRKSKKTCSVSAADRSRPTVDRLLRGLAPDKGRLWPQIRAMRSSIMEDGGVSF